MNIIPDFTGYDQRGDGNLIVVYTIKVSRKPLFDHFTVSLDNSKITPVIKNES
jgi:hypothetical protein